MKHALQPKDKRRFLKATALVALALVVAAYFGTVTAGDIVLAVLVLALGMSLVAQHRNTESRARQQEALLSIFATLKPEAPLPDMEDWSARPDFLKKLLELVLMEKPQLILEAGSGVSTVIGAAALKRLGRGRLITLEHEAQFAAQTSLWLDLHGLAEYAQVVHAPLVEHRIGGESWLWYDLSKLDLATIDLLVIDGPPRRTQRLARYPALPLLHGKLKSGARVLLDDAGRRDERAIVQRWCSEFRDLETRYLPLAKGAAVLRKA